MSLAAAPITMALTSCGRPDLLAVTLDALVECDLPARIDRAIVIDDANDSRVVDLCAERFPWVEVVLNPVQLGQMASIDKLYGLIETPYVFHMEDDWVFSRAPNFKAALHLLDTDPSVSGVCFRNLEEISKKYKRGADEFISAGQRFLKIADKAHPTWFGYSFNPSLVRHATWVSLDRQFNALKTEEAVSVAMRARGAKVAYAIADGGARHIGGGRHIDDPHVKRRARTLWTRLGRSIEKRWRRWSGTGGALSS